VDALKEKFSTQFVKAYSFLGQNNIGSILLPTLVHFSLN